MDFGFLGEGWGRKASEGRARRLHQVLVGKATIHTPGGRDRGPAESRVARVARSGGGGWRVESSGGSGVACGGKWKSREWRVRVESGSVRGMQKWG